MLSLEQNKTKKKHWQEKNGDALPVWGHEINEWPLWAGLRPWPFTLEQTFSVFWCTLLSKDCLWSIHHPSTCNQLMELHTITEAVKEEGRLEKKREKKSWIVNLLLYHRRHWNYVLFRSYQPLFLSAACMSQTVGEEGGGRRDRTFEKPFHTAWSGDMDPMRQRRGTQYFKVI